MYIINYAFNAGLLDSCEIVVQDYKQLLCTISILDSSDLVIAWNIPNYTLSSLALNNCHWNKYKEKLYS